MVTLTERKAIAMLRKLFLLALALVVVVAYAGPPLICWPFDIGDSKSLPWGAPNPWKTFKQGDDLGNVVHATWNSVKADYDVSRLVEDVTALLAPEMPVLVRMETLRRAAVYARKDERIAAKLQSQLTARALDSESLGAPDRLAWFDAGYFAECYKQAGMMEPGAKPAAGPHGYKWIARALALGPADAEMHFAAALVTVYDPTTKKRYPTHDEHLRKAVQGAAEGSMLGRNVVFHFRNRGTTLSALRAGL